MTFQEAVAEMRILQEEYYSDGTFGQKHLRWLAAKKAEVVVDQMLSQMSRENDFEMIDDTDPAGTTCQVCLRCNNLVEQGTFCDTCRDAIAHEGNEEDPFPPLTAEPNTDTPTDRARDAALRDCIK